MTIKKDISTLESFIPAAAVQRIMELVKTEKLVVKLKQERKTRHGDYRLMPNGWHQITVNSNLNQYKFLITLTHEIAHLVAYKSYGRNIKPHGKEWKLTFKQLMLPFINPEVFPSDILPYVAKHFINPKASSDTDLNLARALKQYDAVTNKHLVVDLKEGQHFKLYNGRIFERGSQRRKRITCKELPSGKLYLFNPLAEVDLVE